MRMLKWMRGAIDRRTLAALATVSIIGAGGIAKLAADEIVLNEGLITTAVKPVPGDPCTYAYGSTRRPDGSPVKCGDKIARKEARVLLEKQLETDYYRPLKKCAGDLRLSIGEGAALLDMAWRLGPEKVCRSTTVRNFRAGDYDGGCKAIYLFDRLHGRKCSLPQNRNRKDGCKGVMNRLDAEYKLCTGAA